MCIMAGHIALPSYQKERLDEFALPATLSSELIIDLLKNEMGYDGVVMSDALIMNGFRTTYSDQLRSELECFKCGIDMMLWPTEEFAPALEKAILSGEIPQCLLDDAVERILAMKEKLGLIGGSKKFKEAPIEEINELNTRISQSAVTLVRDRKKILPQKDIKRVAIIAITKFKDEVDSLKCMASEFEKCGTKVFLYENMVPDDNWEIGRAHV